MNIAEEAHVVNILPPLDADGSARVSDYFSLKDYGHASILLTIGQAGAASQVTLEESTNNAGGSTAAIPFHLNREETAGGDTLAAREAVSAAGFATSTNNNTTYILDVDASELSPGAPYLVLKLSDPGVSTLVSAVAILSDARHGGATTVTAIT